MSYLPFIQKTLEGASEIALDYFGKVTPEVKLEDNNQVLTAADLAVGKFIIEQISSKYPDHNIIDEEAGTIDNGSNMTWVVDPIDGTSNFAVSTPLYGCMLGLLKDDTPVAGGVVLPALNELYLAEKGSGATRNGVGVGVSKQVKLSDLLVAYGLDGHSDNPSSTRSEAKLLGEIVLYIRNLRSSNSVFDIMMTAVGSYGAFLNQTSRIWDNVAPQVIVEEAGGVYTDFYGQPINYVDALSRVEDNFTVCAASPLAHRAIQSIIHNKEVL